MNTSSKRIAALRLLDQAGIWKSNAAPPIFRMFWAFGWDVPPPHFISFTRIAVIAGFSFGALESLFLVVFNLIFSNINSPPPLVSAVTTGMLFGISMATYYAYGRRKHRLPRWSCLS